MLLSLQQSYSLNLYHHQLYHGYPFIAHTNLCSSLSSFFGGSQQCRGRVSSLLYNINLYYNQSNSLRIKRDLFPAFQNKWTHVNPMHQYHILFDAQRRYNIIIYVVLLALKAYRPFSRIAKSNLPKCKSLTLSLTYARTHVYTLIFSLLQNFFYTTIFSYGPNSIVLLIFNNRIRMLIIRW